MGEVGYLRVKNWEQFQHYSRRTPPWIKFHRALLNDYTFANMPDETKAHLVLIWLLASDQDGKVVADSTFIRDRIGAQTDPDLDRLIKLGFLIPDDAASKALASDASNVLADTETVLLQVMPQDVRAKERRGEEVLRTSRSPDGDQGGRAFDGPRPSGWSQRLEDTFNEFWEHYPRKVAKGEARKVWKRLKPYPHLETIHKTLKRQSRSDQWRREDGRFIPHPATWLNSTGWESTGIDKNTLNGKREFTPEELESAFDA